MNDFAHANLLPALEGIADGKNIDEHVTTRSFGKKVRIFEALNEGINLDGIFHADHLHVVDAALGKFGRRKRTSDNISEVTRAMLPVLIPRTRRLNASARIIRGVYPSQDACCTFQPIQPGVGCGRTRFRSAWLTHG